MRRQGTYLLTCIAAILTSGTVSASLTDGLAAHYPFAGNAQDVSGNDNHATVHGATLAADRHGRLHSAYHFDGLNDYLRVSDDPTLDITGDLSISLWVRGDTFDEDDILVHKVNSWGFHYDEILASLAVMFTHDNGNSWEYAVFDHIPDTGSWIHLATTRDAAADTVRLYVNGFQQSAVLSTGAIGASQDDFFMGGFTGDNHAFFGDLDEVRIYNRLLTPDEVLLLSVLGSPPELHIQYLGENQFELTFPSWEGLQYQLQGSDDRQSWVDLGDSLAGDGSILSVIDTRDGPWYFWRVFYTE